MVHTHFTFIYRDHFVESAFLPDQLDEDPNIMNFQAPSKLGKNGLARLYQRNMNLAWS